jgi:2-polyprenyl-3-methyl-5-hydroxy-6-metoxy-1,4-benzoquinol methylase
MMFCSFCGGELIHIYNMNGYKINQCKNCYTSIASPLPSDVELIDFYNGFLVALNILKLQNYLSSFIKKWLESYKLPVKSNFLDLGGGGGFISYAFEYFGFGDGYYLDIDKQSCDFARNELKLKHVVNQDIKAFTTDDKFDLIFCRHVLEHLKDPFSIIKNSLNLLKENGTLVLIFPNGLSYEYIGHPRLMKSRIVKLLKSNNWNIIKILRIVFSRKIAHGIDPIRHLWAISDIGIDIWLKTNVENITFKIKYANIDDKVYSPHYFARNRFQKPTFLTHPLPISAELSPDTSLPVQEIPIRPDLVLL